MNSAKKLALVLGLFLVGCARDAPSETPPTQEKQVPLLVGEPCALSSAPQVSSKPPRIFVELATLEGDLTAIQQTNTAAMKSEAAPRTFSQMLADPRWKAISVRHVLASDGTRQTFPWEFGPPLASRECPASERWVLSLTPHVTGQSPVMVRVDIQIVPAPSPHDVPSASPVPPECGARTTLLVRDQQVVVLSGFPTSTPGRAGLMTTVTPYVIWEDADLRRLGECKAKRAH
ncbi:MAG TPA: hypothetical protein VFQ61_22680 [Polyangiaceae bacterium]|nr:hypothetical protein [Polyangiaceae bacterium]